MRADGKRFDYIITAVRSQPFGFVSQPAPALDSDVFVIGGGPAGSTAATLLARDGYRVVMAERETHPRFHIGESLLPMNLPIFERLGVTEQVERIGVKKRGADFSVADAAISRTTLHFRRAFGDSPQHAYEVRRADLDELLFRNAEKAGANTLEDTEVTAVVDSGEAGFTLRLRGPGGDEIEHRTRFVLDATGRDALMARSCGWQRRNRMHASAAIFGHFRGVGRRPGTNQGNISIYWFEHGWIWMIPLPDDVMSVGAVCRPAYLKTRKGKDLAEFFRSTLALAPRAEARFTVFDPVEPVRVTGNYSYRANRMTGPGFALVGDAYAFIDPVFSSGVYLAMNSAERVVPQVRAWLSGDEKAYRAEVREFEGSVKKGLSAFSWFIYRFTSPGMRRLFQHPRNTWQVERAVISLLAGDVFRDRSIRRRLRLFQGLYALASLAQPAASLFSWRQRKANLRHEFR